MKFHSVQILRAFAAWMVVFHHFMQYFFDFEPTNAVGDFFSEYGMFGVDIFFVISGFIMAFILTEKNEDSAGSFLKNRLIRIVPNYWIWTFVFLLFGSLGLETFSSRFATPESLLLSLLFITHMNPDPGLGLYPTLSVGWTLNFEMFFYMLIVTVLMWRLPLMKTLLIVSALLLVSPVVYKLTDVGFYRPIFGSIKLFEFVIGILLFYLWRFQSGFFWGRMIWIVWGSLLVLTMGLGQIGLFTLLLAGSVLFMALRLEPWIGHQNRLMDGLVLLGTISYSTYLAHPTVLRLLLYGADRYGLHGNNLLLLSGYTVSVFFVSLLSYKLIEQRFAKKLKEMMCR